MTVAENQNQRRKLYRRRERLIKLSVRAHRLGRELERESYFARVCDMDRQLSDLLEFERYLRDWPASEVSYRG